MLLLKQSRFCILLSDSYLIQMFLLILHNLRPQHLRFLLPLYMLLHELTRALLPFLLYPFKKTEMHSFVNLLKLILLISLGYADIQYFARGFSPTSQLFKSIEILIDFLFLYVLSSSSVFGVWLFCTFFGSVILQKVVGTFAQILIKIFRNWVNV